MTKRIKILAGVILLFLFLGLALVGGGKESGPPPAPVNSSVVAETQLKQAESSPREVVVYASDLPKSALSEFEFWNDPASPGGRMIGTPNNGEQLDPRPANDP